MFSLKVGEEWRKQGGDEELLKALEPHPNLKWLRTQHYQGIKNWIMPELNFLRKLVLHYWRNCAYLPALGKLPSLESLEIKEFESVKKVSGDFLGVDHHHYNNREIGGGSTSLILFPKLIKLEFFWMKEWEE